MIHVLDIMSCLYLLTVQTIFTFNGVFFYSLEMNFLSIGKAALDKFPFTCLRMVWYYKFWESYIRLWRTYY